MADLIRKMQEGHTVEDLDTVIDEVYEARGEYDSLGERLDGMSSGTPAPASSTPSMDGTGSAGTADTYARGDHTHPSDTSKQNALSSTQLDAVNSGINSTKVEQIETNKNNISKIILAKGVKSSDLNNVTDSEFCVYADTATNLPTSAYYFVRTSVYDENGMLQEAYQLTNGNSYIRTKNNGVWNAWKKITP